ncbi:MAG: YcgN family cysteine cluster protein [Proteobacteria bacterium]|nr:MAG: YcgN family cysteine cluster protein [Pseudomonadota bacterium]
MTTRFWERVPLAQMTDAQWESLCDGCGRCCLVRFENPSGGGVFYTRAACRLLDTHSCRCGNYRRRFEKVRDCLSVRELPLENYRWLPATCAYRLVAEGKPLAWWHPLVSGDPGTVIEAGVSVAGRVVSEEHVHPQELDGLLLTD